MSQPRRRPPAGYQIRPASVRKDGTVMGWAITIPREIGEVLGNRARPGLYFRVELVDDGILLRPATEAKPAPIALPAWARNDQIDPTEGAP